MFFSIALLTSLLFSMQQFGGACGCEDKPQVNILAVVNGVKIVKRELGSNTQNRVSELQDEVVKARNAELDLQINSLLLDAEAKRRGLTAAKLLELEVVTKVPQPTEEEAEAFYNQRKERVPDSFKNVKADIIAYLKAEREQAEAAKFVAMLRGTAVITILARDITPPANEQELNRIFARVNNRSITSRDIEESLAPLIYAVQEQVYKVRKQDLDEKINDMLLDQEAKRQNTTTSLLFSKEVKAKLPIITDQQAKAFYDENRAKINQDFEKVKYQILQYLLDREQQRLTTIFADQLRRNAAVQIYLTPPEPPTLKISTDDQPTRGNANASVTVVQFTDFECSTCSTQHPDLERLIAEFGTQAKFVVRDFPLNQHQNAIKAAEAAEAAREQGKYWEYSALLYANQSALQLSNLKQYATQLGLDRAKFDAAVDSGRFKDKVQRDMLEGAKLGVNSTPSFFINGKRVADYSYAGLKAAIQATLSRSN